MSVKNSTILAKAWLEGTNDFQQRIPNPDTQGYANAIDELFQPYNHDLFNQFANMLVGMMGTYVHSKLFENPLRELKRDAREWGNTAREVAVKWLNAHSYEASKGETLLKLEKPEFREWFFSWSKYEMSRVFSDPDSYGYDQLLAATLDAQRSSDNYDEMQVMLETFAFADQKFSLYRTNLTAAPSDKATGQELLAKIKADAGMMYFPSTKYNNIDVPVFETREDTSLILWVTPAVDAVLDVYTLAELFNVDRAEVRFRKILIPEFPIPNVVAALTSDTFVYARDVWYGIEPPFYNPANRTYKYYLFHDQMIGVNPLANCILYTTDAGTEIPTIEQEVTGMQFADDTLTCKAGETVKTEIQLVGTVTDDVISVQPNAATYSVACTRTVEGESVAIGLNSRTYVDKYGVLHVQKTGLEVDDVITITATSAYVNPSGTTTEYTATCAVTIV